VNKEITIPLDWGTLAALQTGTPNGRPVLFLHGWLDNAASFAPLVALLPQSWNCVVLDLPGHGHSDHRPKGTAYHLIDAVADVLNAADALGWERFTLVGHSLGAGIASVLAGSFSERLDALALIEGIGPLACTADETPVRFTEYFKALGALKQKRLPIYADLELATRSRLQGGTGPMAPSSARRLVERGTQKVEGGFTWRSDPRLRLPTQRFTEDQTNSFLRSIHCPTLALVANEGLMVRFNTWQQRAALVEKLTIERLPGGHHLHLDDPAPSASAIASWVNSL
jgi:pimeloyl-ACP methyl ester carboxylesterase